MIGAELDEEGIEKKRSTRKYKENEWDQNEDKMPLFLINGFLEAGKTQFIKFTMGQDYFQTRRQNT